MRFPPLRGPSAALRHARGVALIIVLAFVVLLTGLVVAFFSRSVSERLISNSSSGQVKIDLFAQGAVATITDDLKQEIAAGSNAVYYTDANGTPLGSVYQPITPAASAPALALKGQSSVSTFAANLLKRSAYRQNFFPGNGDTGSSNYNTGNTFASVTVLPGATPSPVSAPARPPANRAANLSTTVAAPNGRSISIARWNKALLLPKGSSNINDPTVLDPDTKSFVAPDWIFATRDGSNPGSLATTANFNAAQTPSVTNPSPANPGYITGRYAYTIYDEGGLLDANVAGYPTVSNSYPSSGATVLPVTPTFKANLAYADLTVPVTLPGGTQLPNLLTAAQVNTLVGWRNYASGVPTGTFPNYTPGGTVIPAAAPSITPIYSYFDVAVLTNTNGFLGVNRNAALNNHQSDRTFGSRQELINFFTQALPLNQTDTAAIATLQNSLQYFGTFSRGLNQPSYVPVSRVSNATNPNPRPLIQPSSITGGMAGGGNNVGDFYTTAAQQDVFNPSLLSVRVEASTGGNQWKRNDGITASVPGEPLLKSRFPLQRLAWITYEGPSALRSTNDTDMQQLMSTYNIPLAYLKLGTVANIQKYFGLTWDTTKHYWKYNVHNAGNTNFASPSATGRIMTLRDIADQRLREPDFFEILKASVDPGALGKASTNGPVAEPGDTGTAPNNTHYEPLNYQFFRDVSVDAAIIQLGANIIDQFDLDGYPTRIVNDDGSGAREIHGVENLPYIYRLRTGALKVREANPASERAPTGSASAIIPLLHSGTQAGYTAKPLVDTGVGVIMTVPDIWNPHDQNSSLGFDYPGKSTTIRLVANSAAPDTVYTDAGTSTAGYNQFTAGGFVKTDASHGMYRGTSYANAVAPDATAKPPIPYFTRGANPTGVLSPTTNPTLIMSGSNGGFNNPHPISLTTSSYLTFQVPNNTLFREPTLLGQADPVGASALAMVVDPSYLDIIRLQGAGGVAAYVAGAPTYGLKCVTGLYPLGIPNAAASTATQGYIGMILGAYPLRWVGPRWSGSTTGTLWNYSDDSLSDTGTPVGAVTYSLQYQDPQGGGWVTYDEKYVDSDVTFVKSFDGQLVQPAGGNYVFADPRTARFGAPTEANIGDAAHYRAPLTGGNPPTGWASNWLDQNPTTAKLLSVATERPDISSGFGTNFRGTAGEWGITAAPGLHTMNINTGGGPNNIFLQTGLFAQNDPNFKYAAGVGSDGMRFASDTGWGSTPAAIGPRDGNFWSDPDGVVRRAMGAYVKLGSTTAQPLATATTITNGVGKPGTTQNQSQSQSRPIILNRPFRSVAELGYVFSGNPWKNVDFSTPESAYSELLDVFCVNEPDPSTNIVAGTVNLNTRQPVVLQSVLAGAYTDEEHNYTSAPPLSTAPLAAADAQSIARLLVARTSVAPPAGSFYASYGPQPLQNVADLVGRWKSPQTISGTFTPSLGSIHNVDGSKSYDGLSADLTTVTNWISLPLDAVKIPRLRESAARALSNVGNTRVWNLMIDVITQTGEYPASATSLDQFTVEGSQRYWLHIAIDRLTGNVLDQNLEAVPEGSPTNLALTNSTVPENQAAGTAVGTLVGTDPNTASTLTYTLVSGAGSQDNASFTISNNVLQTAASFQYLNQSTYNIRVRVVDQESMSFEKTLAVTVTPGAYTRWKVANFADKANDPATAGDLVDADHDGTVNLLEYALGTSPLSADVPAVSLQSNANGTTFNYTRLTAATDVTTHVYWTSDLTNPGSWSTSGVTETMLSDDGTLQHWQATLPTGSAQRAFLRLQVTKP